MATTIENNKMIATFMGMVYRTENNYTGWYKSTTTEKFAYRICNDDGLIYHLSWNKLMKVIEKIEKIGISVEIKGYYNVFQKAVYNQTTIDYTIHKTVTKSCAYDDEVLFKYHSDSDIDKLKTTYQAVVKFIEWYNTQKV